MKKNLIFVIVVFLHIAGVLAQQPFEAKITIRVIDELGRPVTNAPVSSSTIESYREGTAWWGDVPNYHGITVYTDGRGIAEMVVPKTESALTYGVRNIPGYYWGGGGYNFAKSVEGRWQPWNPTVELTLKAIGVQVPLYARMVLEQKMPNQGVPIGFDLMLGDWVSPYGKGKTPDFIFQMDSAPTKTITNTVPAYNNGTRTWTQNLWDNRIVIRFSNQGDGIRFVAGDSSSGLPLPRLAPLDGYESTLNKRAWLEPGTNFVKGMPYGDVFIKEHSDYQKDANYFFRVRTQTNSSGAIVSALYGKIYGDIVGLNFGHGRIGFTYYLNPEPNSRNMEFDPKKNLFKNLKPMEQVTAP